MAFVLEVSLKANHVLFVFRVRQIDLLKNLDFLQTSFSPEKATSFFVVISMARTTPENIPFPRFA
jgi:hypothetical protein